MQSGGYYAPRGERERGEAGGEEQERYQQEQRERVHLVAGEGVGLVPQPRPLLLTVPVASRERLSYVCTVLARARSDGPASVVRRGRPSSALLLMFDARGSRQPG